MNLFSIFSSKKPAVSVEQKGYDSYSYGGDSAVFGMPADALISVTPRMAYRLAEKNPDLGKAVGDIAGALASMVKGISDGSDEIDYHHPLVLRLNEPSADTDRIRFFRELSESFLLCNEAYIIARGNVNRPPLELEFIRPYDVSIMQDSAGKNPVSIYTTAGSDYREYKRQVINGRTRYIDNTGLNELLPIRGAVSMIDEWRGRAPVTKLFYDIMISLDGKRHNLSQLENGMKTSGILTPKSAGEGTANWPEAKVRALESHLRAFSQGAGNAGNVLIIGTPAEVQGLSQSNRDMDFVQLLEKSQISIFNLYNVPLPLVLATNMTYSNFTTANRTFYTKAVFPVFEQICEGLMFHLRGRYGLTSQDTLVFDEAAIRDMRPVMIEDMKMLSETQAVSTNEVRRLGSYEDVDGGDDILVMANKFPLTSVASGSAEPFVNPQPPSGAEPPDDVDGME